MLINNKKLTASLTNFSLRNSLMRFLTSPSSNDLQGFYKKTLALWLGSNATLLKLEYMEEYKHCDKYLYHGYATFLLLDKYISLIPGRHMLAYQQLHRCRVKMFKYFNENYELLLGNPKALFEQFNHYLNELDAGLSEREKFHYLVLEAKEVCQNQIGFPVDETLQMSVNNAGEAILRTPAFTFSRRSIVGSYATKMIVLERQRAFYLSDNNISWNQFKIHTLVLPSSDGVLLDGLFVGKRDNSSNDVMLILAGHYPAEEKYLGVVSGVEYQRLFDCDIVLMNHRNFSTRAILQANNVPILADDVIAFVNYFRSKGRNIRLYGMCGGVAQMLLAAQRLTHDNVPYKLIVDRFNTSYSTVFDAKTLLRVAETTSYFREGNWFKRASVYECAYVVDTLLKLFMLLTQNNYDFANILSGLPQSEVLVLQARSKKQDGRPAKCTDMFVHPENDLRKSQKSYRHQQKEILKSLKQKCVEISDDESSLPELQRMLVEFHDFFKECLFLIDNEKLQVWDAPAKVTDLHGHKLYDLTTRHYMDTKLFFHGFFAAKSERSIEAIDRLASILDTSVLTTKIREFIVVLSENKNFISHMSGRVYACNAGDMNVTLNQFSDVLLAKFPRNEFVALPFRSS